MTFIGPPADQTAQLLQVSVGEVLAAAMAPIRAARFAAVATGGVSLLAKRFKERFIDEKDACGKAVRDAEPRFAELRAKYRPAASSE